MENNVKVLIVDDNSDNLDMLEIVLKSKNYSVKTAINGKVALEMLHNDNYELIVSDILMPVMDGFQLCRECKADMALKDICFIFYTATYIDSKDEAFALSLGAQEFIRKPQDPEILLNKIQNVFEEYKRTEKDPVVYSEVEEKEILKLYSERLVAKLEKKNLDLEKEVDAHKKTLNELMKAKLKAEESDKLKTAFLTNMSHEVRTPMNGIIGFTNLLKSPNLTNEEQNKFIDIIQMSGNRLINLIEDLINISKIETGQMELFLSEFGIKEAIENIYNYFKKDAENKGLKLKIQCFLDVKSGMIKTDRDKFDSILTNLLKNAVKYTQQGEIEIGCNKRDENFELYIKDTGIGIPRNRIEFIFDRFVQADIFDSMAFQGAGLGLAITKSFLEMLNGNIHVESEEGKGTVFYLTLPCNLANDKYKEKKELELNNKSLSNQKKIKILIAEDDETSVAFLSFILKNISSEILHVKNGKEAIDICLENSDIDLILMDIKMPELDGAEAVKEIRKFNKDVIIIAQTAYALSGDKEKFINSGFNDYVSKPILEDELIALIQKNIKLKKDIIN